MEYLKSRREYLRASDKGAKCITPSFIILAYCHGDYGQKNPRAGFTASKKIGNAVIRNRAKRRLKEAVRISLDENAREYYDYVLIARKYINNYSFSSILKDLEQSLNKLH
jgi:ribonuclease P protein component